MKKYDYKFKLMFLTSLIIFLTSCGGGGGGGGSSNSNVPNNGTTPGIGIGGSSDSPGVTDDTTVSGNTITVGGDKNFGTYIGTGALNNHDKIINVSNGAVGIGVSGPALINDIGTINVAGGTGLMTNDITPKAMSGTINLIPGNSSNYSVGICINNVAERYHGTPGTIVLPDIKYVGTPSWTIKTVVEGTVAAGWSYSKYPYDVVVSGPGVHNIGLAVKGKANITAQDVIVNGDTNLGIYSDTEYDTWAGNPTIYPKGTDEGNLSCAQINVNNITVGNGSATAPVNGTPIGVFTNNYTNIHVQGNLTVGNNSIGMYNTDSDIYIDGKITVGDNAAGSMGVYGAAVSSKTGIDIGHGSVGLYARSNNKIISSGKIHVSNGSSVGMFSRAIGYVKYDGDLTVDAKGSSTPSIGIFKSQGRDEVTTKGTMDIGDFGYGIYADNVGFEPGYLIDVENSSKITLHEGAVGIYSGGEVKAVNSAEITVGSTYISSGDISHTDKSKFENSVGMYGIAKSQLSNASTGNIIVDKDHSVGVYVSDAGTIFTNSGTINVNNGGIGVIAKNSAQVINNGNIVLGYGSPACSGYSVGVAAYSGAKVTNNGNITVGKGTGVYIGNSASFENKGTIVVDNGIGIAGPGTYTNSGITVIGAGIVNGGVTKPSPTAEGAVTISNAGTVILNNRYIQMAGTLEIPGNLLLNGAKLMLSKEGTVMKAASIDGNITLDPSFVGIMDNGYQTTIDKVKMETPSGNVNISIDTSPMYSAKYDALGESITIIKRPYASIVKDPKFSQLYDGIDDILKKDLSGTSKDSLILKNMGQHLESIYDDYGIDKYNAETKKLMGEMRGDIYSTVKSRMDRIDKAFDASFDDLLYKEDQDFYNGKFNLVYNRGKMKDNTYGIDDYKYNTVGFLYMKEFYRNNKEDKFGFSVGAGLSRFDFDDSDKFDDDSKEDVYSVKLGVHNVSTFGKNDDLKLITRLDLGYNRHEAERTLELDKKYKNKGKYDTYSISFDNKIEKTIYKTSSSKIDLYAKLDLKYDKISGFTEKSGRSGGIQLKIKEKDYFSANTSIGVKGQKKIYVGKKLDIDLTGDLGYGYDFGGNKGHMKAKVTKGDHGYYSLIRPKDEKSSVRGRVGISIESKKGFMASADIEARKYSGKKDVDIRYGIRVGYKF